MPGPGPGEEYQRYGRTVRSFVAGISAEALAMAWARQENAPQGSTVVVGTEVSPIGLRGRKWPLAPMSTLAFSVVVRPPLSPDQADALWLVGGVAAVIGGEAAGGRNWATWWPEEVRDLETGDLLGWVKADVQLGPAQVRFAILSFHFDLNTLGLVGDGRDQLLESVLVALDKECEGLSEGTAAVAGVYSSRHAINGRRVRIRLMPKGETRGVAARVDAKARLELESSTGMIERISVDQFRELFVVA
ncbi:MAG: hypothetical protein ACRD0F_00130 [Acidimicrobiales bacterium]